MLLESYGLDAAHYFSAPGMAWNAALKMTKVKLELFTDKGVYSFIERSICGGVSQISKRYAKANKKQCHDYDPLKPITHLIYLDANNLYGWAISQYLPTKDLDGSPNQKLEKLTSTIWRMMQQMDLFMKWI